MEYKVKKNCKCRYCHYYRPREGHRCWGFNDNDIKKCIEDDYHCFRGRQVKILAKIKRYSK